MVKFILYPIVSDLAYRLAIGVGSRKRVRKNRFSLSEEQNEAPS